MPLWYVFLRLKAWFNVQYTIPPPAAMLGLLSLADKQRVLTPGHQGWNDLHSLCRIVMENYLLNNNNNDNDNNYNNNNNNDDNDND